MDYSKIYNVKPTYNIGSVYNKAPELLLEKLAEANGVLVKVNKGSDSYKFWKSVVDVMKFSWGYMNDFYWIIRENEVLRAENEFLKHWSRELSERLQVYEAIKAEKLAGTFEKTIAKVDKHLKNNGTRD